ncbi:peptidoglycan-binding protein [Streptomyces sp. NPDC088350]|uniref:peptidoglycan-binding domain-containing protein n=1 Tax=Streptomyces sp. NPDC088350 TaxID=3365854 RepID=UPI0038146048
MKTTTRVLIAAVSATSLVLGGLAATATASPNLTFECPDLAQGLAGPCVAALQEALNANGANLVVDGIDGPLTAKATRAFQTSHGLAVDGIAGPDTKAALTTDASVPTPHLTAPADPPAPTVTAPAQDGYNKAADGVCNLVGKGVGAAVWVVAGLADGAKTWNPAAAAAAAAVGQEVGSGATTWVCKNLAEIPPAG